MLDLTIIGNLGADAVVKAANGCSFISFRVAHTDAWTDGNGVEHSETSWVDCAMNFRAGEQPRIFCYLKKGQRVYVRGPLSLRTYSSKKDRCIKAGAQCAVRQIELLGGVSDDVPRQLFDADGVAHQITRHYYCDTAKGQQLIAANQRSFSVDGSGWVTPIVSESSSQVDQ